MKNLLDCKIIYKKVVLMYSDPDQKHTSIQVVLMTINTDMICGVTYKSLTFKLLFAYLYYLYKVYGKNFNKSLALNTI